MNLFYTPPEQVRGNALTLTGDEAGHAVKVLRFQAGDVIFVTDGAGTRFEGRIESAEKNKISISILDKQITLKPFELVLVLGLIKNRQRLEFAVEKAVELGATEIILFKSDHSERGKVNTERLQAIALSAMKQSLRSWLPAVLYRESLEVAMQGYTDHVLVAAHEKEKNNAPGIFDLNTNYLALAGPEGGFSDTEIRMLTERNARLISLGDYRLRSETAVVALLSRFV